MNTLFFDTETTGLSKTHLPHTHEEQPMPVQVGMKLDAANMEEMLVANLLIETNTVAGTPPWTVSQGAYEQTGIDNKKADTFGVHLITAIELFLDMVEKADVIVAHNINYDIVVIRRAVKVYCDATGQKYFDPFADKILVCTMLACTDILKLMPKRRGQWKWPKLVECTQHFFNEDIDGAHDALVDVRACAKVYYHLHRIGALQEEFLRTQ